MSKKSSKSDVGTSKKRKIVFNPFLFESEDIQRNWPLFENRKVLLGRPLAVSLGYKYLCDDHLSRIGWNLFFDLPPRAYPKLVRLFYCNLRAYEDDDTGIYTLDSYVKGVNISLNIYTLSDALDTNIGDHQAFVSNETDLINLLGNDRSFLEPICTTARHTSGLAKKDLRQEVALLHFFLQQNVHMKGGQAEAVRPSQIYSIYCMLRGIPLDLNTILLHEMASVLKDNKRDCLYGLILTKIFSHFEVDLSDEDFEVPSSSISESSLRKITFDSSNVAQSQSHGSSGYARYSAPPPDFPASTGDPMTDIANRLGNLSVQNERMYNEFRGANAQNRDNFDRLGNQVDFIGSTVYDIDGRVAAIQDQQNYSDQQQYDYYQWMHTQYPQTFPVYHPYPGYMAPQPPPPGWYDTQGNEDDDDE